MDKLNGVPLLLAATAACSDYNLHHEVADSLEEIVYIDPCVRAIEYGAVHYPSEHEADPFGNPTENFLLTVTPDFSECGTVNLTGVQGHFEGRFYDVHMILDGEEQADVTIESENFGSFDDEDPLSFELYNEVVLYGPNPISIWPFDGEASLSYGGMAFDVQECDDDLGNGAFGCTVEEVEVTYTYHDEEE